MSANIRAVIVLAAIAAAFLFPAIAEGKEPKAAASKVHMCESTDLYFGPVTAGTRAKRIAETCKDVSVKAAARKINACAAEGPEVCEVLYTANLATLLIEHKISTSTGDK